MLVLVKTDNHVIGNASRSAEIEAEVRDSLERFEERLTRVEVKFFDDNSREKKGTDDLRCVIEARPAVCSQSWSPISWIAPSSRRWCDRQAEEVLDKTYDKLSHTKAKPHSAVMNRTDSMAAPFDRWR